MNNLAATRDFQQCCMCDQQMLRRACVYAQSEQSLCLSLEYSMAINLLNEQHLDFLSLKGGCTGSSKSTLVKLPHCWKSHVAAQLYFLEQYGHFSIYIYLTLGKNLDRLHKNAFYTY